MAPQVRNTARIRTAKIVIGVVGATLLYMFGMKPYLDRRRMQKFEDEARAIFEMRLKRQSQGVDFKEVEDK